MTPLIVSLALLAAVVVALIAQSHNQPEED